MSPKIRVFLIYGVCFLALFFIAQFIVGFFIEGPSMWRTFIPIGAAVLLSPKPHIEETQSGRQYGLKSIFSKKIIRF